MFLVTGHPIFISCRHVFNAEVRDVTRRCLPYVYYLAISLMTFESSRFFAKNDLIYHNIAVVNGRFDFLNCMRRVVTRLFTQRHNSMYNALHSSVLFILIRNFMKHTPGNNALPVKHALYMVHLETYLRLFAHHFYFFTFSRVSEDIRAAVNIINGHYIGNTVCMAA